MRGDKYNYISDNDFTFYYSQYERDVYNGRCYRLEDSTSLRKDCDGKLARRRISAKEYEKLLENCKLITDEKYSLKVKNLLDIQFTKEFGTPEQKTELELRKTAEVEPQETEVEEVEETVEQKEILNADDVKYIIDKYGIYSNDIIKRKIKNCMYNIYIEYKHNEIDYSQFKEKMKVRFLHYENAIEFLYGSDEYYTYYNCINDSSNYYEALAYEIEQETQVEEEQETAEAKQEEAEVEPQETAEAKQEIIINKMIERINFKIGLMNSLFTGWSDFHALRMAEIDGMIDMLSIATGKEYAVTENGLIEMDE